MKSLTLALAAVAAVATTAAAAPPDTAAPAASHHAGHHLAEAPPAEAGNAHPMGGHGAAAPAAPATAGSATVGDLAIAAAWVRGTPPGAPVAAGYLTITNRGTASDRLVGGAAPFARRVEVHEMSVADGMMQMRPVADGLEIAPGTTATLSPGGTHVMFIGVTAPPRPGDTVPVTLRFRTAGEVTVAMPVSAVGAQSPGR